MANGLQWSATSAPAAGSRYDDVCFKGGSVAWAVNSNGHILKTSDDGESWAIKFRAPITPSGRPIYLRCITFANANLGFVGTLTREQRLYRTVDGGESWSAIESLPPEAPVKICGLFAANDTVIYGSGTNDPSDGAAMIKSTDAGKTWTAWDMSAHASSLIDVYFPTPDRGWVVGGFSDVPQPTYENVKPVVLHTADGGKTWEDRLKPMRSEFPLGTWGWKIQFLNDQLGFVSLENMTQAFILKTTDGGKTWAKIAITGNANLEGVGFLNADEGWVGGWGDEDFASGTSSVTADGGRTWQNANSIGRFINRFRFRGSPVEMGYAAGRTIYKYAEGRQAAGIAAAAKATPQRMYLAEEGDQSYDIPDVPITFTLPKEGQRVTIHIWNRFGKEVRTLIDEKSSAAGPRTVLWDRRDDQGNLVRHGVYICRLTIAGEAESRIIALR